MAIDGLKHTILMLIIILVWTIFVSSFTFAQNQEQEESSGFYTEETESGIIFHQKLSWKEQEYVLRYVVSIQHKITTAEDTQKILTSVSNLEPKDRLSVQSEDNEEVPAGWEKVLNCFTTEHKLELTLPSGSYRYRIHAYNLLNRLAGNSGWIPIEIYKARQPEITEVAPAEVFLEDDLPSQFLLSGINLLSDTKFNLFDKKGRQLPIISTTIDEDKKNATLTINPKLLTDGIYTFKTTNPGGKSTTAFLTVKFQKPIDTELSAGYRPSFIIYDSTFSTYFGSFFFGKTTDVKLCFVPLKRKFGSLGILIHPQFYSVSWQTDYYSLNAFMWTCAADFAFKRTIINRKLFVSFYAGPSCLFINNLVYTYSEGTKTNAFNSWYMGAEAGCALQYFFTKGAFAEVSCDAGTAFLPNMSLYAVSPGIRIGYQF